MVEVSIATARREEALVHHVVEESPLCKYRVRALLHTSHEVKKHMWVWMGTAGKRLVKWKDGHTGNPLADDAEASDSSNPLADDAEDSSNSKGPTGNDNVVVLFDDGEDYS